MFMPIRNARASLNDDFFDTYAKNYDVAIITIGRSSGEGGSDRNKSDLTGHRETDDKRCAPLSMHKKKRKVIVVLNVVEVSWKRNPGTMILDAILLVWQPGEEAGNAIADILSEGFWSGKLSDTFPFLSTTYLQRLTSQLIIKVQCHGIPSRQALETWRNVDVTDYARNNVGYRYFVTSGKPVSYPFGYGLYIYDIHLFQCESTEER